jgi:TonB family protein
MPLPHQDQVAEIKSSLADAFVRKQRRQMLTALTLLLVALILTLIKDRKFWFPTAPVQSESEPLEETSPQSLEAVTTIKQPAVPRRRKAKQRTPRTGAQPDQSPAAAPIVMSRTVLPPLEVEVVAGDEHREVQAGSNSVKVDLRPGTPVAPTEASSATPESAPASVADATTRMHLSPGASQILSRPVEPNYPLLAKQMKIQGAVVLQVLIGRDGTIQHLHVVSGPTILSAAAREAVKQWRFKPFLQSGEAVETTARVTVNFTIWT